MAGHHAQARPGAGRRLGTTITVAPTPASTCARAARRRRIYRPSPGAALRATSPRRTGQRQTISLSTDERWPAVPRCATVRALRTPSPLPADRLLADSAANLEAQNQQAADRGQHPWL